MTAFDGPIGDNTKKALKNYIDRIENIEEEKAALSDDIKAIYANAKSEGFDTKIMRQVIRRRKMEKQEREEIDSMIEVYEGTLDDIEQLLS